MRRVHHRTHLRQIETVGNCGQNTHHCRVTPEREQRRLAPPHGNWKWYPTSQSEAIIGSWDGDHNHCHEWRAWRRIAGLACMELQVPLGWHMRCDLQRKETAVIASLLLLDRFALAACASIRL